VIAENTKLLVVGGGGFIGKHIVQHAASRGWHVVTLGRGQASDQPPAGVFHIQADIADREALCSALENHAFDYVVNCGGHIDHRNFFEAQETYQIIHDNFNNDESQYLKWALKERRNSIVHKFSNI